MEERDFDVCIDGKYSKRHLLALIYEYQGIKVGEADRKLLVGTEQIHLWCKELSDEGLIDYPLQEGDDAGLSLTKEGFKILKIIENDWKEQEMRQNECSKKKKPRKDPKKALNEIINKLGGIWIELIVVMSVALSAYLIKLFIDQPDAQAASFVGGSFALSTALLVYSRYQRQMKSKTKIISFSQWIIRHLRLANRSISLFLIALAMIYCIGLIFLHFGGLIPLFSWELNVILVFTILLAATTELVYYPDKTLKIVSGFYLGILLIVLGLMIVLGMINLTESLFGSKSRVIDLIFGIGFLVFSHINRKTFGFSRIIKEARLQREKEKDPQNP